MESVIDVVQQNQNHISVMKKEVLDYLDLSSGDCFVDCTIGLGGHSVSAVEKIGAGGKIIGIDRDRSALSIAEENLSSFPGQSHFVYDDFRNIDRILDSLGISQINGILFDLGVSSLQLDDPQRGFSFKSDGPLDMRMDQKGGLSAFDVINTLSQHEISLILKDYGQERMHNRIARYIVEARSKDPIKTTKELSNIILRAMPRSLKRQKIHPATRTFQAFRIMVNRELESLEIALHKCIDYLEVGARICVISFHSLEDRIVKQYFRNLSRERKTRIDRKKNLYAQMILKRLKILEHEAHD